MGIAGTVGLVNQLSGCNGGVLGGILNGKITQTNVPLSAICPEVMARYNSWTAPTSTPTQA